MLFEAMRAKLLRSLPMFGCDHQFSWPRRWRDGEYYQVCVRCGAEYLYDWSSMQRGRRFERDAEAENHEPSRRPSTWRPRARRLAVDIQVQFREQGAKQWSTGIIRNLSETGVLITSDALLPQHTGVELNFVMPKEISGQENARVLTSGKVVRAIPEGDHGGRMAATIQACRFLTQ